MSVSSISFSGDDSYYKEEKEISKIEESACKSYVIWGQVYDVTVGNLIRIISIPRNGIGAAVRDLFYFPLKCSLIANMKSVQNQIQVEETYARDFWDPAKPVDPNLQDQAKIRALFAPPEDRVLSLQLASGKNVELTVRVIETKQGGDNFYNFVQVTGVYGTISNNMGGVHPYLSSYLNAENQETLPPARFIMVSENNLNYKPASLEEAGSILLEALKALKAEFGNIDQLVAHSLGNIFLASALRQVDDPTILPEHICLDRAPTSTWEASKKYFWGLGRFVYFFAKLGRWAEDIEESVVAFCQKWEQKPTFVIAGVVQDHHFSGSANLCLGEQIKKLDGIDVLVFDPPRQIMHQTAHHNLRANLLNACYLQEESSFMKPSETFSDAIIRQSVPKTQEALKTA